MNFSTIYDIVAHNRQIRPASTFIIAEDGAQLTYGDAFDQITRIGAALTSGCAGRRRVVLILPNGPAAAMAFLAAAAFATSAPLNPNITPQELLFYIDDIGADAIVVSSETRDRFGDIAAKRDVTVFDLTSVSHKGRLTFGLEPPTSGNGSTPQPALADECALVLHTSGTTSRPKLVPLTHRNITASARNVKQRLNLCETDRCLNIMPLFHIHGLVGALMSTVTAAGSIICTRGPQSEYFSNWLRELSPTWYTAVPTMHRAILTQMRHAATKNPKASLRFIRSSSSSLPPAVMQELENTFGVPVVEAYGMTEAAHQMACNPLPPAVRKPGSVGVATGVDVAIMDESGSLLATGATGEVVIRGESVTAGYANNPDANRASFCNGWFRTGDQGYLDDEGYLFLSGRLKEIINRGGEKISPREIDEALEKHPAIEFAVAFSLPHPTLGEDLAAAVVLEPGADATERELRRYAATVLADHKVPTRLLIVDHIPKGPSGKLQRIGLADVLADKLQSNYVPPRSANEKMLVEIWSEVLEKESIGIDDRFFMIGGDSLAAGRVTVRIVARSGVQISVSDLFEQQTIRALATILDDRESAGMESGTI